MKRRLLSFSKEGLASYQRGVKNASRVRSDQADAWALSLASDVRKVLKRGYPGLKRFAHDLDALGSQPRRGGKWTPLKVTQLLRRLVRLGIISKHHQTPWRHDAYDGSVHVRSGVENVRQVNRAYADAFALRLSAVVEIIRRSGLVTFRDIAQELNRRDIATRQGKHWQPHNVRELCRRIREAKERR